MRQSLSWQENPATQRTTKRWSNTRMDLLDECDAVAVLRCDAALLVFHVYLCADSAAICGFARRILQDGRPGDRGLRRHPAAAADSARDFVRPLAQTKVVRPAGDGGFLRERAGDVAGAECGFVAFFPRFVRRLGDSLGRDGGAVQQLFLRSRSAARLWHPELAGVRRPDGRDVCWRAGGGVVRLERHVYPGGGRGGARVWSVAGDQGDDADRYGAAAVVGSASYHAQPAVADGGGDGQPGPTDRLWRLVRVCAGGGEESRCVKL